MESDRSERVAELVEVALDLEPVERINFLHRECADDTTLRREIESLLCFQAQASRFIETPACEVVAGTFLEDESTLPIGTQLAGYTVDSLLGEGGMGEVYLARDEDLGRKVAIKLIKRGFTRAAFIRQFRQEERILAGLTHPNIAQLHGVGVASGDLPYFVMECVEGDRLDDYCQRERPTIRARLEIFQKICAAVSYAHQHLVIHRDLKPGNIRVSPEGEPKLLDFGIAKLIDDAAVAPSGETIALAAMMTPEYASPEQVRGEQMTTASDVYSLGVILYEMLTGAKPYRITSRRPEDISRTIGAEIPARPSALAEAKALRGDLDNIVLMAMRKEPDRRYASVAQFSNDIARHLAGRPVIARRDTWNYRSGKFIARHRAAVAGAMLVLLSLLGGIIATDWQARRAEEQRALAQRRFDEVRRLARSLIFEIHDSVADLPGSTSTRELIVSRALEYLNNLSHEAGSDPTLARELAAAYVKIGNVQGNPNNSNLGDRSGALESYRKAERISERVLDKNPDDPLARRSLGLAQEKIADVEASLDRIPAAVTNAERSLAAFQKLAESAPQDAAAQLSFAISLLKMGDVLGNPNYPNRGDTAGALSRYQQGIRFLEAAPPTAPDDSKRVRMLGLFEERLGTMLELTGDLGTARQHYEASKKIRLQLAHDHPENSDIIRDAAIAHEKIANMLVAAGELDAAFEGRQRSLEIFTGLAEADAKNVFAQRSLAISYYHLAELLGGPPEPNLGRREDAIRAYERATEILAKQADANDAKTHATLAEIRTALTKLQAP